MYAKELEIATHPNAYAYAVLPQHSLYNLHVSVQMRFHNVAAASTAPATLKDVLFVNRTSTGYSHSIYLAQPADLVSHYRKFIETLDTYSNMQTSYQSISPDMAQPPLSTRAQAAVVALPILAEHLTDIYRRSHY